VLSASRGIVHPYYTSAVAPGAAAMVGGGSAALVGLIRRRRWWWGLALAGVAGTVVVQLILLHREHYLGWLEPVLIGGAALGLVAMLALPGRWRALATALVLALLLVGPTAYATTVWSAPVEGTFPAAGPHAAPGPGGVGVRPASQANYLNLISYLRSHRPTERWTVLTDATSPASPLNLLGIRAGAMGGYSGTDPILNGPGLARLIRRGDARYVLLGGPYASRGGNQATAAVAIACRQVPQRVWRGLAPAAPSLAPDGGPLTPPRRLTRAGAELALAAGPPAPRGLRRRYTGSLFVASPRVGPLAAARPLGPPPRAVRRRRPAGLVLMPFSFALYDCGGRAALLEARG
jgi:hypothetical protein